MKVISRIMPKTGKSPPNYKLERSSTNHLNIDSRIHNTKISLIEMVQELNSKGVNLNTNHLEERKSMTQKQENLQNLPLGGK